MSITSVKLARLTTDAIGKLKEDPIAVTKVQDSYQGYVRPDTSVGKNIRATAKSYGKLIEAVGDAAAVGVAAFDKVAKEEAQDKWLHMNDSQRKVYGDAVKKGQIGPADSPFVNRHLADMFAADEANKYSEGFQVAVMTARFEQGDDFELSEFSQEHFSGYVKQFGLDSLPSSSFTIFGKGVEQVHNQANLTSAKVKASQFQAEFVARSQGEVSAILNNATLPLAGRIGLVNDHITKIRKLGLDAPAELTRVQGWIEDKIVRAIGDEDDTLVDELYAVAAGLQTGEMNSKANGGGYRTLGDNKLAYASWKAEVRDAGYKEMMAVYSRLEAVKEYKDKKLLEGYQVDFAKIKNVGDTGRPLTDKEALSSPQGMQHYEEVLAQVQGGNGGEKARLYLTALQNAKNGGIGTIGMNNLKRQVAEGNIPEHIQDNPALIKEWALTVGMASPTEAAALEVFYRDTLAIKASNGVSEFIALTTKELRAADKNNVVPIGARSDIAEQANKEFWSGIAEIVSDTDLDKKGKAAAIVELKARVTGNVDKQISTYNQNQTAEADFDQLSKEVVPMAQEYFNDHKKEIDNAILMGSSHQYHGADLLMQKVRKGTKLEPNERDSLINFHLKNNQWIKIVSEMYGIPLKKENLKQLLLRKNIVAPTISKLAGAEVNQEQLNASKAALTEWLSGDTGEDEVQPVGVLPDTNTSDEEESISDTLTDVGSSALDAVSNALFGSKANASADTPQGEGVGTPLTDAEKATLDGTPEEKKSGPFRNDPEHLEAIAAEQKVLGRELTNREKWELLPDDHPDKKQAKRPGRLFKGLVDDKTSPDTKSRGKIGPRYNIKKEQEDSSSILDSIGDALLGKQAHAAAKVDNPTKGVMNRTVSGHTMAQTYNASTTKEKANYEVGLAKVRKQLATGVGLTPAMKKNITMMKGHFKSGVGAFSEELKNLGMSSSEFITSAIEIYGQETVFGTYINPETKAKISSTGARGEMQIVYPTFVDMAKRNIIGDKAYKAMGTTRAKVKAMLHDYKDHKKLSTAEKAGARKFLLDNHKANAIVALAKMVNGMKAWKDAGNDIYDET